MRLSLEIARDFSFNVRLRRDSTRETRREASVVVALGAEPDALKKNAEVQVHPARAAAYLLHVPTTPDTTRLDKAGIMSKVFNSTATGLKEEASKLRSEANELAATRRRMRVGADVDEADREVVSMMRRGTGPVWRIAARHHDREADRMLKRARGYDRVR